MFIVEEEWVEEDFFDGESYEEHVMEEDLVEDEVKPSNLLQRSTSNADLSFDGSTIVEFDLGSYNGESSSGEGEPGSYEEACRELIKQIYPQGGSHDEDDMIRRCDLRNLYKNLKQQHKFLVHSKQALAENDRNQETWESFDDSNGAFSVEAADQAIISFDEPLHEGEAKPNDGSNHHPIWPEMEGFADPWEGSNAHNYIHKEDRDANNAIRDPVAVEETQDEAMMDVEGESSVVELIPWLLRHADDPDDYEAACRELIPIVYKDEHESDVDTMLRRSNPKDLYRHLKHQHWYLTHTGAISEILVPDEQAVATFQKLVSDRLPASRDKKHPSLDDIWLVGEHDEEEVKVETEQKYQESIIEESAVKSRDANAMDEDCTVQARDKFENTLKALDGVDGTAQVLNEPTEPTELSAQTKGHEGSRRSLQDMEEEKEREVVKWLDRYADDPDDYEEASRKLIAVLYGDDDEYDAETTLSRSSSKDLFRYLKQQYWYRVHMGTIPENALEQSQSSSNLASHKAPEFSESIKLIDTVKRRISLIESTNFRETHQLEENCTATSVSNSFDENIVVASPSGIELEMSRSPGFDEVTHRPSAMQEISSLAAADGTASSDGMDSSDASSSLEPPPGYDPQTLTEDRTVRLLERAGRENTYGDKIMRPHSQNLEDSSRTDASSVYSHENGIDEIKIDGKLRDAILDQMNQDAIAELDETHKDGGEKTTQNIKTVAVHPIASTLPEHVPTDIRDGTHRPGSVLERVDGSKTDFSSDQSSMEFTGLQGSKRSSFTDSGTFHSNKRARNSTIMLDADDDSRDTTNVAVKLETMEDEEKRMRGDIGSPPVGGDEIWTKEVSALDNHGKTTGALNLDGDYAKSGVEEAGTNGENLSVYKTISPTGEAAGNDVISFPAIPGNDAMQDNVYQVKVSKSSSTLDRVDMAKRQNRIEEELFPIVADAEKVSGEPFSEEILAALILAATKTSHLKRYYNFIMDAFVFLPPVANAVLDGSLLDCASRHLGEEISSQFIDALKAASENAVDQNLDYEYMNSQAVALDITFPKSDEIRPKTNISNSEPGAEGNISVLAPLQPEKKAASPMHDEHEFRSWNSAEPKEGDQGVVNSGDLTRLEEEAKLLFGNYQETKATILKQSAEIEQARNLEIERIARELESLEDFHKSATSASARKDRSTERDLLAKQLKDLKEDLATAKESLGQERSRSHSAVNGEEKNAGLFGIFGMRRRPMDLEQEKEQQAKLMQQKIHEMEIEHRMEQIKRDIAILQKRYDQLRDEDSSQEVAITTRMAALLQESREIEEAFLEARNTLVEGLNALEERRVKDEAWYRREKATILTRFITSSNRTEGGDLESDQIVLQENVVVAPLEAALDEEVARANSKSNIETNRELSAKANVTSYLSGSLTSNEAPITKRQNGVSSEAVAKQDPSGLVSNHQTVQPVVLHSSDMDVLSSEEILVLTPLKSRPAKPLFPDAQNPQGQLIQVSPKSPPSAKDSSTGKEEEGISLLKLGEVNANVVGHSMVLNQRSGQASNLKSVAPVDLFESHAQLQPDKALLPAMSAKEASSDLCKSVALSNNQLDEKDADKESIGRTKQEGTEKKLLMLFSSTTVVRSQQANQNRSVVVLKAQNIKYESIDGADPNSVATRNELFKLSNLRGTYPQFFVVQGSSISFVGTFETFQDLNDKGILKGLVDDREERYRQEFMELLERDDKGESVDEGRLYHLQLYARRRVGEELSASERRDLEEFEREEAKIESTDFSYDSVPRRDEVISERAEDNAFTLKNGQESHIDSGKPNYAGGEDDVDTAAAFQQPESPGASPASLLINPSDAESSNPSHSSNPDRLLVWRKNGKLMVAEKLQACKPQVFVGEAGNGFNETLESKEPNETGESRNDLSETVEIEELNETDKLVVSKAVHTDNVADEKKSRKEVLAAKRKQIVESRRAKWGLKSDKKNAPKEHMKDATSRDEESQLLHSVAEERRKQRLEEAKRLAEKTARAREARLAREAELHSYTEQVKRKGHILTEDVEEHNAAEEHETSPPVDIQQNKHVSSNEGSLLPHMVKEVERLSGFISRYEKKLETTCKSILSVVQKTGQNADVKRVLNLGLPDMYNYVTDQPWFKEHASDNFSRPLSVSRRAKESIIKSHLGAFSNADDDLAVGSLRPGTSNDSKLYKLSKLGEKFLAIDGPGCGDTGRFLSFVASSESLAENEIRERWSEISRLSRDSQSDRIFRNMEDIMAFCLSSGLIE